MSHKRQHLQIYTVTTLAVIMWLMPSDATWAQAQASAPTPSPDWYKPWLGGLALGPGAWSGQLGLNYMNGLQSSSTASGSESSTTTRAFGESLRIANSGFYVISPLLFTGNLSLDLQLNQDRSDGSGGETALQGKAVGYAFDATFLAEKPYTASVAAHRSQIQLLQPSGARVVGINEQRSATFHLRKDSIINDWGYPWVEANLRIEQQKNQNTTSSFGRSQSTDEQSRALNFDASKGFETADLAFNYQLSDRRNLAFSQGNFQSRAAGLTYSADFGPTLNRRFDSSLNYLTRNGVAPSTLITSSEHLQIDHYKNLSTDYRYGFIRQTSGDFTSTTHNVASSVSHQLYRNLNTSASVNAGQTTQPNGSARSYGGQFSQAYNHSLPGKGIFSANWSGGYQLNSNQLSSSSIGVIDEAHSAQPPLIARTGFLLDHKFVVASSIVVMNVKNGGRVPLRDVASDPLNGDYEVIVENNQIRIVPLPTSLRIGDGDPLAVSYTYQVDANLETATKSSGFGMGVDYHWISMSFGHRQSTQTPLNQGTTQFLQNSQQNFAQIGLQGNLRKMAANANLNLESNKATDTASNQIKFSAGLDWDLQSDMHMLLDVKASTAKYTLPDQHTTTSGSAQSSLRWPNMSMIIGVNATESKYTFPGQRTDSMRSARTSLNWFTQAGWIHTASIDWSNRKEGERPPETLVQLMAQSSVLLGKLSLNANVALGQWWRNDSRAMNRSFNIAAVRQF